MQFFRRLGTIIDQVLIGLDTLGKNLAILHEFRYNYWSRFSKALTGLETVGKVMSFFRCSVTTIDLREVLTGLETVGKVM